KGLTPRNLVAKKEAVIYDIYVEQGKAVVQQDEYVQKGDVLISGTIGDEKHQKIVPAKGKVLGETWYESEAAVPLVTELKTYTGKSYTKHILNVFGWSIPFWGFSGHKFNEFVVESKKMPLKFLKWTLPVTYETKTYKETKRIKRKYTQTEALAAAKKLTKKDLLARLNKKDHILSEKVLRESIENGKVKVLMHYTVIENIAKEQPLIEPKETE
ncbi:MAG TPA: sporulation protein YqfD, partial [Bacillales bacterium]|nr:sporulation protein YqfD [Bacillales bacterium]